MKRVRSIFNFLTKPLFAKRIVIRAVILKDGDLWAVQGLEYDIAAQGNSVHDAMQSFGRVVISWIDLDLELGRTPFSKVSPAPQEFWELFEQGVIVSDPHNHNTPRPPTSNIISTQELRLCA